MTSETQRNLVKIISSARTDRQDWLKNRLGDSTIVRQPFSTIESLMKDFKAGSLSSQWLILPGLRGIGKTTILTQLFLSLPLKTKHNFFISLERIQLLSATMQDVVDTIESLVGQSLESLQEPLYIFIDEVQYLNNWGLGLKTIFDRADKVFIVCSGSSTISLQTNADIARRATIIPMHPLSFSEYIDFYSFYNNKPSISLKSSLSSDIQQILLTSNNCQQVFGDLKQLEPEIKQYWDQIDHDAINDYLRFGSLPFTFNLSSNIAKWRAIDSILSDVLIKDIVMFRDSQSKSTEVIPALLRLLADSDSISLDKLSSLMNLNKRTIMGMLKILCQTSVTHQLKPAGSTYKHINKPNKYLFDCQALRLTLLMKSGLSHKSLSTKSGPLLEDAIGLYLRRISLDQNIHYNPRPARADFVLFDVNMAKKAIPIEVGYNKKTSFQVAESIQALDGKYGLTITNAKLDLDLDSQAVFIPLKYFLLS